MSYNHIADMAGDQHLLNRVIACAAEQGQTNPVEWGQRRIWHIAAQPGWADAWNYAEQTQVEQPGKDESVITDAAILSAVQAQRDNS
jgi:hypothetical protein